jgi:sugar-specific transcriptional regulator TrmB
MPDDLLTRIRKEIDARLEQLTPVADEIRRLEAARQALDGAQATPLNHNRNSTPRRSSTARRRERAPRGANREAILKLIAERPDVGSAELASKTGIPKPTVYATLRALAKDGLVEKRSVAGVSGYHLSKPEGTKRR